MESTTRAGLRVRLKPTSPKKPIIKTQSNAERCREYRSALKADPERYAIECLKNQARHRQNQQRPLTEEEKSRRKETNRLRQQECRARKKAAQLELAQQTPSLAKVPTAGKCSIRSKTKEEGALQMQRQKWAEAQRKRRQQWTAQRRRHDREKALQRYYQRKATVQTVHQEHPPPVPSTEGSSICAFSIPDPLNADGVQVTIDNSEEREGPVTEDVQTMGSLASPAPPLHSSSMKKRQAENKRMGINKRARQLDYNAENTVITEYYNILIEKEKRALEREAEKHKLEKEALEKAAERDKEATKFFAIATAVAELLKQKLETELKQ